MPSDFHLARLYVDHLKGQAVSTVCGAVGSLNLIGTLQFSLRRGREIFGAGESTAGAGEFHLTTWKVRHKKALHFISLSPFIKKNNRKTVFSGFDGQQFDPYDLSK